MPGLRRKPFRLPALVAAALLLAPAGPVPVAGAAAGSPSTPASARVSHLRGSGPGSLRFACIGCGVTLFAASGGTVLGLAVVAAALPEPVLLCLYACGRAYLKIPR